MITPPSASTVSSVPLLDFRGLPVQSSAMRREAARPSKSGARAWGHASVARGLTPERLAGIFGKADKGDLRDLLTLAGEIEERDSHAGAQLRTRKLAVASLPWQVKAASDDASDVKIAEAFAAEVVTTPIWSTAVVNAMDAVSKPFAALEIIWSTGARWKIDDLRWRDQRAFQVSEEDGSTLALRVDGSSAGEPLAPWKWVVHTLWSTSGPLVRRGLVRPLAVAYAIKHLGVGAWLTFAELFGIPMRLGKYAPGAPESEITALEDAVRAMGADASGVMPSTMAIEITDAIGKGNTGDVHAKLVAWAEAQQSKAILGQTMTADSGSSLSQAQVHDKVRRDILIADARALEATFTRDVMRPWIDINYGPRAAYPQLVCVTDEPEDIESFTRAALPWVQAGLEVEASVVRDRLGLPEPGKGAEVLRVARQATAAMSSRSGRAMFAAGDDGDDFIDRDGQPEDFGETMRPLLEEVQAAASGATGFESFLAKLEAASADGDALVKSLATKTLIARGVGDATDATE